MLRSLLKLYLFVVLAFAASFALIAGGVVVRMFHARATQEQRQNQRVTMFALNAYLIQHAGTQRPAALEELKKQGNRAFQILTPEDIGRLNAEQQRDLQRGQLTLSGMDEDDFYIPLTGGIVVHMALSAGGFLEIQALVGYSLIALALWLAVFGWIHPHWRELRKLEIAARLFGAGDLSTRAQLSARSNIYPLARQFNHMAAHIEQFIMHQRDMMRGISHELKTPLARLEFGLALLHAPTLPPAERGRIEALSENVRELDELVTDILTLSRLEQGDAYIEPIEVSLAELLDSIVASVADEAAQRRLTLSVERHNAPAHYVLDPKLLARALLNLIRNSIRYAHHMISVSVTSNSAGTLVLVVEDDGPGIPVADRARVFEPFQRIDASRDRHTGGFGLGLAIVRRVMLAHGGDVWLEARAAGGARFVLTLPKRGCLR